MKKILFLLIISLYAFGTNHFSISLENKSNHTFEDYLFIDVNSSEHLIKKNSFNNLNLNGNFNDLIGLNYDIGSLSNSDKFSTQEIYVGTTHTKYIGYKKIRQDITYNAKPTKKDTIQYTFFNILTLTKSDFSTLNRETFIKKINGTDANLTKNVHRKYNLEINALTTENLYDMVKEDSLKDENYFYGFAISQNFKSRFRLYGIVIASYEQYDYSEGTAYYYTTDINGTTIQEAVKDTSDDDQNKLIAVNGQYKGYGLGYKLTAEAYWDNLSIFITSYMKKITLKNYHSGVSKKAAEDDAPSQVISVDKITFSNNYTTFGLRYRF